MVGRASSWQHQTILEKNLGNRITLYAKIISKHSDHFLIQLSWVPENISFSEILHLAGSTPLPPYIKRKPETSDLERYQTVYAQSFRFRCSTYSWIAFYSRSVAETF